MPRSRQAEISEALRQRIINAVQLRGMTAGARLPSARALAKELDADPRVVTAAYRALAAEGVVHRRPPSRGFYAASDAAGAPLPAIEWLVDVFVAGLARGIHAPELPNRVRRAIEGVRIRAACIECNRDQQVWLCRELEEDYGVSGTALDLTSIAATDGSVPVELAEADLVVTSMAHADAVREISDRLGKPLVVASVRPELIARVHRLLALSPVYFIGTDPRFKAKIEKQFGGTGFEHNVRPVIVGFDDVSLIPPGSHAWVMRTAREALGGLPAHLQVLSTLRAFSASTQRVLLQYVVRSNLSAMYPGTQD